jgi:hypothetical protein
MPLFHGHKCLCGILLVGLLLRIVPILWGIPLTADVKSYHADEPTAMSHLLGFPSQFFEPRANPEYGNSIQYLIGLLLLPVQLIVGKLCHLSHTYALIALICARLANVIMGTACVYCAYRLARNCFDRRVALLSAVFVATSFYHVLNSAVFTLDVPMSLLVLMNLLILGHALATRHVEAYVLLGIASGFLIGTKPTAGVFLAVTVLSTFFALWPLRSQPIPLAVCIRQALHHLAVYGLVAGAVYLLLHPDTYLAPDEFIRHFILGKAVWVDQAPVFGSTLLSWFKNTVIPVGLPVLLLAIASIAMLGAAGRKAMTPVLLLVVFYYGLFGAMGAQIPPRHVIVVAPLLCILAAVACVRLFQLRSVLLKASAVAVVVASAGVSLYLCICGIYLRLHDTRPPASRYIAATVAKGTTLGIGSVSERYTWRFHPWRYPQIDFRYFSEVPSWNEPEIVVLSSYDYDVVLQTLASDRLGTGYVLDERYNREWPFFSPPTPRLFRLYDEIFNAKNSRYELLKAFSIDVRVPIEFPPPEIRIYRRRASLD